MKTLTERQWVKQNLTGKTDGWDDLVTSGDCNQEQLRKGDLNWAIDEYKKYFEIVRSMLERLGYEAGLSTNAYMNLLGPN